MPDLATLSDTDVIDLAKKPESFTLVSLPNGENSAAVSQRRTSARAADASYYYFADESGYAVINRDSLSIAKRSPVGTGCPSTFTNLQRAVQSVR